MQGVYRYKVRGLTAGGGVFTAMVAAQGMYVASVHRMLPGFFKILGGMAKFSKDPSTAEVLDFFRSGTPGVDLSTIPISAGLDVEIEFTLELVKKEWRLKRGSYRWSSDAHFSFSGGEGQITENVRGQGNGALDPQTSSITLVTTGKKGSLRGELHGNVPMTGQGGGKSIITNGPVAISFDYRGDKVIMEVNLPGLANVREALGSGLWERNFAFSQSLPLRDIFRGRETYQDLLDSHVVEEWELWDECSAYIKSPADNAELVYNLENPGQLEEPAIADVLPSFWVDDLQWELEEIEGSDLEPPPEKARGDEFDIIYTNLPKKNSAFTLGEVKARFSSDRAKRAGCKDPAPHDVGYYFPRTGANNPGPSAKAEGNEGKDPDPNWFFYWRQTAAAQGRSRELKYGGTSERCAPKGENLYGYAPWETDDVVICDLSVPLLNFKDSHPFVTRLTEGIDVYAITVVHELTHSDNQKDWWPGGYKNPALDQDNDDIPDSKEGKSGIKIPAPLNTRYQYFDPTDPDTPNRGDDDEHYLAWMAETKWKIGAARTEDWSCPGHQSFTCEE